MVVVLLFNLQPVLYYLVLTAKIHFNILGIKSLKTKLKIYGLIYILCQYDRLSFLKVRSKCLDSEELLVNLFLSYIVLYVAFTAFYLFIVCSMCMTGCKCMCFYFCDALWDFYLGEVL